MLAWLAAVFGLVDLVVGWRVYGCAALGGLVSMVVLIVAPDAWVLSVASLLGGAASGLVWEHRAWFKKRNQRP